MKNNISLFILFTVDAIMIFLSFSIAYFIRQDFDVYLWQRFNGSFETYSYNLLFYLIILISFYFSKIYKYRYDFWEETRLVLRGLIISLIVVLSILALTKSVQEYSRFIIIISFLFMGFTVPVGKNVSKKVLFRIGLWKREAEVYGSDIYIKKEVFSNPYLGYIHASHNDAQTVFIDTNVISKEKLQKQLDVTLRDKKEVLFIPILQSYNFANAGIVELTNARKNLIVLENSLLKKSNIWVKKASDLMLSILLFPSFLLLFIIIVVFMKKEEPRGKIFFKQKRIGQNGKEFVCYKFRSMYENGDEILEAYLKEHPDEIACYDKYHKYKNDPRITKIGSVIRKTSLDELPQIMNVLRGEMSLIGPRPYMLKETKKVGDDLDMILAVKPGITGLWQVSGRNDLDFRSRVEIDIWYTRNWNLWLDIVILVKTIKVVLFRDGAN